MRRPALHRRRPAQPTAWAHPYTGRLAAAVCYADGGDPAPAPVPAADPPKPAPPRTYSQEDLNRVAAEEKSQGRRAGAREALEKFAADNGFTSIDDTTTFLVTARKAKEDQLTEQEKREKALADREKALADKEAAAAARTASANRRIVLAGLGATGADLDDAEALLRTADDADNDTVTQAAAALKERRPELFGVKQPAAPGTPPPAPGGAPAGGPPPHQAPGGKPGDRGREMARLRGHAKAAQ